MSTALIASSFVISKNCNMLEVNIIRRGGGPKPTYDLVAKVNGEGISSKCQIHKINDPIVDCAINLEAFLQHLSNSSFFVSGSSSIKDANQYYQLEIYTNQSQGVLYEVVSKSCSFRLQATLQHFAR
jgi:hypothetical protein